jgi:uncharacterized protein
VALIFDTGPLLAAIDSDDPDHVFCDALVRGTREDLVVPGLVLGELDYWCQKYDLQAGWYAFMEDIDLGVWRVEWPTAADLRRALHIQRQYGDLAIGVVDATVLALSERLGETKVATLDRRHFSVVQLQHVQALALLPIDR